MTDRLKGVWVAFDEDIREDDAEPIINAIKALRGVADVRGLVADHSDYLSRVRVRQEVERDLRNVIARLVDPPMRG